MPYIIYDWAGNKPFGDREFKEFEDAWEVVYEYVRKNYPENEFEETVGEYHVDEKEK